MKRLALYSLFITVFILTAEIAAAAPPPPTAGNDGSPIAGIGFLVAGAIALGVFKTLKKLK